MRRLQLLQQLKKLTMDIVERLDTAEAEDIAEFVEKRETVIGKLQELDQEAYDRAQYAQLVSEITQYDMQVTDRINLLMAEASDGLTKLAQSRAQKSAYESAYAMDSAFIDKKN